MKINFATTQLYQVCNSDKNAFGAITKLKQDLAVGRDAITPGPNNLKLNGSVVPAKHLHITNQIGMAYNFSNQVLTILA